MYEEVSGNFAVLDKFKESESVHRILNDVVHLSSHSDTAAEIAYDSLKAILNRYSAQPQLLDSDMKDFLAKIISIIKSDSMFPVKQQAFRYLVLLMNFRGCKSVVYIMPHEVDDLHIAMELLESHGSQFNWETRYCMFHWLSLILMLPFELRKFRPDSDLSVASSILEYCKKWISSSDKSKDAAALLCAKLVTRNDIKALYMTETVDWACQELVVKHDSWKKFGFLTLLALLLKHGERTDMLCYANNIYLCVVESGYLNDTYRLSRKYSYKILQRVGLCCLKVVVAPWRYERGTRSLVYNLTGKTDLTLWKQNKKNHNVKQLMQQVQRVSLNEPATRQPVRNPVESTDVPELVEKIVRLLLKGLCDSDITARYSASKGIGRIAERLPERFTDDIIEAIFKLFSPNEIYTGWNGGYLALAVLGSRGLILPKRLPSVVDILMKGMMYEEPHGSHVPSSMVRDSACFLAWSLARAFDPKVLQPVVKKLAAGLLAVVSYDREVTCRRAASAAFQEHVGRLGSFPHGIRISMEADYLGVSSIQHSFLVIGKQICNYFEYKKYMIDILVDYKMGYWDKDIRILTAQALEDLVETSSDFIKVKLPQILKSTRDCNANLRHGSTLCIAKIMKKMFSSGFEVKNFSKGFIDDLKQLITVWQIPSPSLPMKDMHMEAGCILVSLISSIKLVVDKKILGSWRMLVENCLTSNEEHIRELAADALKEIVVNYYMKNGVPIIEECNPLLKKCKAKLLETNKESIRAGYATALGKFPIIMLDPMVPDVMNALIFGIIDQEDIKSTELWVDARRAAMDTLIKIWKQYSLLPYSKAAVVEVMKTENTDRVVNVLLAGLNDRTISMNGDIGWRVRFAAIQCLEIVVKTGSLLNERSMISPEVVEKTIVQLACASLDKIDKIRAGAIALFVNVINSCLARGPSWQNLKWTFHFGVLDGIQLLKENDTYPLFISLLDDKRFRTPLLVAWINNCGSINEITSRVATTTLLNFFNQKSDPELKVFCELILSVPKDVRLKGMMTLLQKILSDKMFRRIMDGDFKDFTWRVHSFTNRVLRTTKKSDVIILCVDIFVTLMQERGCPAKHSLTSVCTLLAHDQVSIRKTTAVKLLEAMMLYSDELEINSESEKQVVKLLNDFPWETATHDELLTVQKKICHFLEVKFLL